MTVTIKRNVVSDFDHEAADRAIEEYLSTFGDMACVEACRRDPGSVDTLYYMTIDLAKVVGKILSYDSSTRSFTVEPMENPNGIVPTESHRIMGRYIGTITSKGIRTPNKCVGFELVSGPAKDEDNKEDIA